MFWGEIGFIQPIGGFVQRTQGAGGGRAREGGCDGAGLEATPDNSPDGSKVEG